MPNGLAYCSTLQDQQTLDCQESRPAPIGVKDVFDDNLDKDDPLQDCLGVQGQRPLWDRLPCTSSRKLLKLNTIVTNRQETMTAAIQISILPQIDIWVAAFIVS